MSITRTALVRKQCVSFSSGQLEFEKNGSMLLALELASSNGLLWLAGMALSPFLANVTGWGNAAKLLAVAVGTVLSYLLMRFWIFASGTQGRPKF